MKLYENVVIGNFLYGLGFSVAHQVKGASFPTIINLLQQTPDDQRLGDLFVSSPGVLRIIEFKQKDNYDSKESERCKRLKIALGDNNQLIATSREVHWFIETAPTEESFVSRIVPYLDAYPRDNSRRDFTSFIKTVAEASVNGISNSTDKEQQAYLDVLASCHKSGEGGSGGLIMKLAPDGNINYVGLTSIFENLRLKWQDVVIELRRQEEKAFQSDRQFEQQKEKVPDRSKGGYEREFDR